MKTWRGAALLLLFALGLRLAYLAVVRSRIGDVPESDAPVYISDARTILQGDGYHTVPVEGDWPGVRFAFHPPGYPYFVAACFFLFGQRLLPLLLIQTLLGAITCVWIAGIARDLLHPRAGRAAGVLAAVCPELVRYPSAVLSETLFLTFVVLAFWVAARALVRGPRTMDVALFGALVALGTLVRELALPLALAPAALLLAYGIGPLRLCPAAAAALLIFMPWMMRTERVFGHAQLAGLNRWENIYYGFGPGSSVWRTAPALPGIVYRPPPLPALPGTSEVAADARYRDAAIDAIRGRPLRAAGLFLARALATFDPFPSEWHAATPFRRLVHHVWGTATLALEVLAIAGCWAIRRRRLALAALLGAMAVVAASIGLTFFLTRFRLQLLPELVILAGAGLASLFPARSRHSPIRRRAVETATGGAE